VERCSRAWERVSLKSYFGLGILCPLPANVAYSWLAFCGRCDLAAFLRLSLMAMALTDGAAAHGYGIYDEVRQFVCPPTPAHPCTPQDCHRLVGLHGGTGSDAAGLPPRNSLAASAQLGSASAGLQHQDALKCLLENSSSTLDDVLRFMALPVLGAAT
jgi:hypothetical protein